MPLKSVVVWQWRPRKGADRAYRLGRFPIVVRESSGSLIVRQPWQRRRRAVWDGARWTLIGHWDDFPS